MVLAESRCSFKGVETKNGTARPQAGRGRADPLATVCSLPDLFQLSNPNITIAHRTVVVLKSERKSLRRWRIGWPNVARVLPLDFDVVLNQNPVMEDCDRSAPSKPPLRVKPRTVKNNVVGLPLAGLAGGVHQRRILSIHSRGFTVCISNILEYLDFVEPMSNQLRRQAYGSTKGSLPVICYSRPRARDPRPRTRSLILGRSRPRNLLGLRPPRYRTNFDSSVRDCLRLPERQKRTAFAHA
jgi:hypothetical protein